MTPEQNEKIQVAKEVLKRVLSSMSPDQEDGETVYRDGGNFILQLNSIDFERLQSVIEDLEDASLEY